MKAQILNTQEAPVKWWAAQDARVRNTANKSHWSSQVRLQVDRIKLVLEMIYAGKVYEAYGKRGVSIKIDRPRILKQDLLKEMEQHWALQGITKRETAQGILYRLSK
jgi:hypothetical protein